MSEPEIYEIVFNSFDNGEYNVYTWTECTILKFYKEEPLYYLKDSLLKISHNNLIIFIPLYTVIEISKM